MEIFIEETVAEANARLKEEMAAAKAALTAAKKDLALRAENERIAAELAALKAELVTVESDPRILKLQALGFSEVDARALLPLLAASPATVASLDHLGALAIHKGLSLSSCLRSLIAHVT
jgi:hypothetical protein